MEKNDFKKVMIEIQEHTCPINLSLLHWKKMQLGID